MIKSSPNRRRSFLIAICASTMLISGCSIAPVERSVIEAGNYGPEPSDPEQSVRAYFQSRLKDPYSAQYRFTKPYKAYLRDAPIKGGKPVIFGYMIDVGVNAKNSYGAYIGEKAYRLFMKNDEVLYQVTPNPWFTEPWYR